MRIINVVLLSAQCSVSSLGLCVEEGGLAEVALTILCGER